MNIIYILIYLTLLNVYYTIIPIGSIGEVFMLKYNKQTIIEAIKKGKSKNKSMEEIAQLLEISKSFLYKHINEYNLDKKKPANRYSQKDIDFLKKHYSVSAKKYIMGYFSNRSWENVVTFANTLGLKRDIDKVQNKPKSELKILLEDTLDTFYWCGFLAADGCFRVRENNKHIITLRLAEKDKHHVIKFKQYINSSNKIRREKSKSRIIISKYNNKTTYHDVKSTVSYKIEVSDSKIVPKIMNKFGFKPNKTYYPPDFGKYINLDTNLFLAFLIGFIDGDGSLKIPKNKNTYNICIRCHSSWFGFFEQLTNKLEIIFKTNLSKPYIENYRPMVCFTIYTKEIIKQLKQFALENNLPIIERKWDKVILQEGVNYI